MNRSESGNYEMKRRRPHSPTAFTPMPMIEDESPPSSFYEVLEMELEDGCFYCPQCEKVLQPPELKSVRCIGTQTHVATKLQHVMTQSEQQCTAPLVQLVKTESKSSIEQYLKGEVVLEPNLLEEATGTLPGIESSGASVMQPELLQGAQEPTLELVPLGTVVLPQREPSRGRFRISAIWRTLVLMRERHSICSILHTLVLILSLLHGTYWICRNVASLRMWQHFELIFRYVASLRIWQRFELVAPEPQEPPPPPPPRTSFVTNFIWNQLYSLAEKLHLI